MACAAGRGVWLGIAWRAVIESMNGARFVHDTLEELGWDVSSRTAQGQGGWRPLACKTDRIDARVLAELSWRDLVPAIWLPDPTIRRERELARFRLHLVRHRTTLKNRIHATLITFGHRARSATCSALPGASCSTAWLSPTRGAATSTADVEHGLARVAFERFVHRDNDEVVVARGAGL